MRFPSLSTFGRAGPDPMPGLVSRRRFFGASAGAAGVVLGSGLWTPAAGDHKDDENGDENDRGQRCPAPDPVPNISAPPIPNPIIAACTRIHGFFPGNVEGNPAPTDPNGPQPNGRDPSTIFNFDGVIGQADLVMTGTGTDTTTGQSAPYDFGCDMRFMAGRFVATDGQVHKGAFAFI
jgi:hypothetical protein